MQTVAPAPASRSAMARPIPREAPGTTATPALRSPPPGPLARAAAAGAGDLPSTSPAHSPNGPSDRTSARPGGPEGAQPPATTPAGGIAYSRASEQDRKTPALE